MKKNWIIIAVIAVFAIMSFTSYNGMVKADQGVKSQWSKVESSYQRRADLIPNLVNTVKGYASHERETLEAVVNARAKATGVTVDAKNLDAASMQKFQQAQAGLGSALSKLMVVVEKYPDLKANQNFLQLQAQLEGTENRINTERNRFSEAVQVFNSKILSFPNNIMAGMFGFEEKEYYEAEAGVEKAPEVSF